MSAFDWWAARIVGAPWAYTTLAAEPSSEAEPVHESPMLTTYADTVLEVEAGELDVVADLHRLTAGGLSPWEACAALFGGSGAEAGDGSDGTRSSGPQKAAVAREEASRVSL